MIKKWFSPRSPGDKVPPIGKASFIPWRITPFLLISVFAVVALLYHLLTEGGGPGGWRFPLLLKIFFLALAILLADLLLKWFIIDKIYWIWVIEIFLCLGLVYYWIVS